MALRGPLSMHLVFPDGSMIRVKDKVILGRSDFKGFASDDELNMISSKHFNIYRVDNIYYLEDGIDGKPSQNGTMLNGQDISSMGKQPIRNGDAISIADVVILKIQLA
jgi:pSer/pThr/pTyr-binding forkhead associated (FHA) protein